MSTDYVTILFKVIERDDQGRPKLVEFIHADEVVHMEGGEAFFSASVHVSSLGPA